jgi:ribosome biogenesis GTPase
LFNHENSLDAWGWNASWDEPYAVARDLCPSLPHLVPARVTGREGPVHLVETPFGPRPATVSGRLQFQSRQGELPLVGDWVVVQVGDDFAVIHAVVARRTVLARAVSDGSKEAPERRSVLAANLDVLAILTGLDGNFNPRRAQRLATLARHGGVVPLWVLTKTDLPGSEAKVALARESAGEDPVVALSAVTGDGVEALEPWLQPGTTVGLAGSSGVGKTTLVNRLVGTELATSEVRGADSKGRHTTTARHLYRLPTGALLMDAPGFRTVGLWADEEDLAEGFGDVEALARGCRFADCRHDAEPGCAVRRALDDGTLSSARWEGWRRQARELAHLERREDPLKQRAEKDRWKSIHQSMRGFNKQTRSGG